MLKKTRMFNVGSRGWVLLEVMGCCLFLGVVLMVFQAQIKFQWEAIKSEQQAKKQVQLVTELEMMRSMLHDPNWLIEFGRESNGHHLNSDQSQSDLNKKPTCKHCSGSNLEEWFKSRFLIK